MVNISAEEEITITMNADNAITATFSLIPPVEFTLSLSAHPEGAGTLTAGGSYTDGASVVISVTAADSYKFVKVANH